MRRKISVQTWSIKKWLIDVYWYTRFRKHLIDIFFILCLDYLDAF